MRGCRDLVCALWDLVVQTGAVIEGIQYGHRSPRDRWNFGHRRSIAVGQACPGVFSMPRSIESREPSAKACPAKPGSALGKPHEVIGFRRPLRSVVVGANEVRECLGPIRYMCKHQRAQLYAIPHLLRLVRHRILSGERSSSPCRGQPMRSATSQSSSDFQQSGVDIRNVPAIRSIAAAVGR